MLPKKAGMIIRHEFMWLLNITLMRQGSGKKPDLKPPA